MPPFDHASGDERTVLLSLLLVAAFALAPNPAYNTYCNGCNEIGVRNIELGWNGDTRGDIAAVSRLSLCWDLCSHGLVVYDSHHHALARFGPGRKIVLYVRPRLRLR